MKKHTLISSYYVFLVHLELNMYIYHPKSGLIDIKTWLHLVLTCNLYLDVLSG